MSDSNFRWPGSEEIPLGTSASAVSSASIAKILMDGGASQPEELLKGAIKEYPVTLALPPELLMAIGTVCSHWAVAEWILAGTVCTLMNVDRKKGRVVLGTRIGDSASKVKQLMEMESIPIPSQWPDLRERIDYCESAKNLLVHGVWMNDEGLLCVQDPSGEWKEKPPISKRKYPQAFYPTKDWFKDLNEKMRHIISELQLLDKHIAASRSK